MRTFSYNFEQYSAKDIIDYIQQLGYETEFDSSNLNGKFVIKGTNMYIRFPFIKELFETNFGLTYSSTASVLWINYPGYYCTPGVIKSNTYDKKDNKKYKEHKSLFNKLKRKFAKKKGEIPKSIKDLDWIKSLK